MNNLLLAPPDILMDPVMDESFEFLQNPYPLFEQYRAQSPVAWSSRGNHWIVTGYEEANQLLRDNNFGKKMQLWKHPNLLMRSLFSFLRSRNTGNMLLQDAPDHTRVRTLVQSAFLPATVRALEAHIREITDNLTANINPGDRGDLIAQLAFPLPVTVIAELLGIPASDRDQFKVWSTTMTSSLKGNVCPYKAYKSFQASRELRDYLRKVVSFKRQQPANDLLSTLAQVQLQEEGRLSEQELLSNSVLVLIAGHETTVNLIGNGMYHLLRHPQQKQMLLDNPHLIDAAIEEFLRFDPPVQIVRRVAYKETGLGGKRIMPKDAVTVLLGACNRDPRVFDHGDQLDIQRDKIKHLSFGMGIHYCLGAELARSEARIAVSTLLRKFPDIKLAADQMIYKAPFALRGLQELQVIY
jgi:pimeloyl-[acyl-carrier protein] synthase